MMRAHSNKHDRWKRWRHVSGRPTSSFNASRQMAQHSSSSLSAVLAAAASSGGAGCEPLSDITIAAVSCSLRGLFVRFVRRPSGRSRQRQLRLAKSVARACSSGGLGCLALVLPMQKVGLLRLLVCYETLASRLRPTHRSISRRARIIRTPWAEVPSICVAAGSPTASLHPLLHCPRSGGTVVAAHAQAH